MNTSPTTVPSPAATSHPASPVARSIVLCGFDGLADDLASVLAHAAGVPPAYFDPAVAAPLLASWCVENLDEYVAALHEHSIDGTGAFVVTLRWRDLRRLHRQAAGLRQATPQRLLEVAEFLAPRPAFVWLRDTGGLVVSHSDNASETEKRRAERLRHATDAVWEQWFDAIGADPVELVAPRAGDRPTAVRDLLRATIGRLRREVADGEAETAEAVV